MAGNKVFVTWQDVENYLDALVKNLADKHIKPTGVYGIPRGGLIFAVLLSHKLDVPLLLAPAQGCVVIDDIADSGRTLLHYTSNDTQFNKYLITTMYYHERSVVKPDFWLHEKGEQWIVFPWEYDKK